MTDPLGQSQVLPYLKGIHETFPDITILSAEKKANYERNAENIRRLLENTSIRWNPFPYHRFPPVLSTLWDLSVMQRKAGKICRKAPHIVHCRSYIAALTGLKLKRKYGTPLIFDMRGFWPDERVDGGLWNLENPFYRLIYRYFKKKERTFFEASDAIISLTHKGKKEISDKFGIAPDKITVIPCCADRDLFNPSRIDAQELQELRSKLNIPKDALLLTYLGSLGTWYLLDEMLDLYKVVRQKYPSARLLFVTPDPAATIMEKAKKKDIPREELLILRADRQEVPALIAISDAGLFFITKCFSKIASSPTKMGEFLSMGIPVIANNGVGDVEEIINDGACGHVITDFTTAAYENCANGLEQILQIDRSCMITAADKYFDLDKGIEAYLEVYRSLVASAKQGAGKSI